MSEHFECDGQHEHNQDRVQLELTPSGLRLNILGLLGELFSMLKNGQYDEAMDIVDVAGQMLSAAYLGQYEQLDESYENAVVDRFHRQLEDPEVLSELEKGETGE